MRGKQAELLSAPDARFARLLAMVPYVLARPGVALADVAAQFGVTPAEATDDLLLLWNCGLPGQGGGDLIDLDVDALETDGVVYLSNADYLDRPLRLNRDEGLALVLALTYVRDLAPAEADGAIGSALAKLRAALGPDDLAAGAATIAGGSPEVRTAIADAIARGRRLRLVYDAPQRSSEPVVEPRETFVRDGLAYLLAYAVERDAWRTYRLDRIASATVLAEGTVPRPEPEEGPASWSERFAAHERVTLVLGPAARWVPEYVPTESVEPHGDDLRVTLGVLDPAWLRHLLLRLGPDVLAVEPAAAAEPAREAARVALARYNAQPAATPGAASTG